MIKILITGANGQLGCEIRAALHKYSNIIPIFTDIDTLDICKKLSVENIFDNNKIDFLINCAAYTAVDKAENDIELSYAINSKATENLTLVAKKHNTKIIHISTDYVFDGSNNRPYEEDDKINPQNIYGKSKAEGEIFLLNNYAENSIIIRTSWLYSIFGNNFVKTMIRLGETKEFISVVYDQIGTPTNAADLANVILNIVDSNNFTAGIYHYSNEGVCSWYDFAHAILRIRNYSCILTPIESCLYPTQAKRPHYSVLNKSKIKSTYNIKIDHWYDSLKKTLLTDNF